MDKKIVRIVVTGGPCAGKTTAMSYIRKYFSDKGYCVLIMSETATELINSGIAPWSLYSKEDYQRCQLELQNTKENVFYKAAQKIKDFDKIIIVYDRGMFDSKAYMGGEAFNNALNYMHMNEKEVFEKYDAVFHLISAANGAESFYTVSNNTARIETVEEASVLDRKFTDVWKMHRYFKRIECFTDIEDKMNNLIAEIEIFLDKFWYM